MQKHEVLDGVKAAAESKTLLTPKHSPSSIGTPMKGYRTVTVGEAEWVGQFVESDQYDIYHYKNKNPKHSPDYFEIVPHDPDVVPGSGIPAYSPDPTHPCDRFVAVSGVHQGWHIFAEQKSMIDGRQRKGSLQYVGQL